MKAAIVKEDGLIYVNEVPEEPEYCRVFKGTECQGSRCNCVLDKIKYERALASAKDSAIRVSDQEKAKRLIWAEKTGLPFSNPTYFKPGIYPIPDLQWDVVDVKIARALSTGGKHKQMPLNGEVAILKQSLPTDHEILNEAGSDLQNIKAWMRDMNYNNSAVFWDSEDNTVLRVADIIQHYLQWIGTEQQVAILKESTPSTESQEELWKDAFWNVIALYSGGGIRWDEMMRRLNDRFTITRKP